MTKNEASTPRYVVCLFLKMTRRKSAPITWLYLRKEGVCVCHCALSSTMVTSSGRLKRRGTMMEFPSPRETAMT